MTRLRRMMLEELQRRNYAKSTVKTYIRIIQEFASHFHQSPDRLGPQHLRQYQAYLFQEKKLDAGTVQQHVAALRFFYVKTLKRRYLLEDIPRPKRYRKLPEVLSPEEVAQLIDSASNLFHRTMLMTLYSTGIRRAELCRLQVTDIDSKRMMVHIRQGKGGHDRDVPLSEKLLETLRVYWRWMKRHIEELASGRSRHYQGSLGSLPTGSEARGDHQAYLATHATAQLRHAPARSRR